MSIESKITSYSLTVFLNGTKMAMLWVSDLKASMISLIELFLLASALESNLGLPSVVINIGFSPGLLCNALSVLIGIYASGKATLAKFMIAYVLLKFLSRT